MALGINTNSEGGEFKNIIKFDARAGRFFRVDRAQDSSGQWNKNDVDITNGISFIMDLASIEVGWASFAGGVPDFKLVKVGEPLPPRPAGVDDKGKPAYKQGFRCPIKLAKSCGGDAREWAHTAKVVLGAVDDIHNAFLAAPEAKQGKLPVIRCSSTRAVKSGQSTNYAPVLEIAQWVERPSDLPLTDAAAKAPPPPAASAVPPPAQQAPAQPIAGAEF